MLVKKLGTSEFSKDAEFINGLQSHEILLQRHVPLHKAKVRKHFHLAVKYSHSMFKAKFYFVFKKM